MYPYIIKQDSVTVFINGTVTTIQNDAINYNDVVTAIKSGNEDDVVRALNTVKVITDYMDSGCDVTFEKGSLKYRGVVINNSLTDKIIEMREQGFEIKPMLMFLENLMKNPSKRAVDELYSFVEKANLPITEDGQLIAFKKVQSSFMDIYSGTVNHKPANLMSKAEMANYPLMQQGLENNVTVSIENGHTVVRMPRNGVDDDASRTCSSGLHFCSREYLDHFGWGDTTIIVVKVNPADVVSIPSDYNATKGRTCAYSIIGVMETKCEDYESKPVLVSQQDYDDKGRPLSMTPNAIRKRAKRAAAKLNK